MFLLRKPFPHPRYPPPKNRCTNNHSCLVLCCVQGYLPLFTNAQHQIIENPLEAPVIRKMSLIDGEIVDKHYDDLDCGDVLHVVNENDIS